jgi:hypothetical protein
MKDLTGLSLAIGLLSLSIPAQAEVVLKAPFRIEPTPPVVLKAPFRVNPAPSAVVTAPTASAAQGSAAPRTTYDTEAEAYEGLRRWHENARNLNTMWKNLYGPRR